ncbi:hypothetical protein AMS68_004874 [Peltaster fructicola]|uniref:Uncharacterized protein n=1 Tax=Peltaster fructicola TaxID=286661 RepID=A0A6H0XX60_9PEZI|nr:hypothetical protein AMS68_004874 [Peltaster fructicola]
MLTFDSGVASVAIRSLAHAAEVLTDRREQEEVLEIFEKINKETGWRIGFVYGELKEKWGWNEGPSPNQYAQTHEAATKAKESQEAHLQQQAQAAHMQLQQGFDFGNQAGSAINLTSPAQSLKSNVSPPVNVGRKRMPSGIPNPLYAKADFSLPQHPYQNFYVAPSSGYGNAQTAHAWWNNGETTT